jgi:hypothetical protein
MSEGQGILSDGTPYTYNPCNDPNYPGCIYVSLGTAQDHMTFIISDDAAGQIKNIEARGADKRALASFLRMYAVAMLD